MKGLVFCKKLDENRVYSCDPSLLHYEERMRNKLEQPLFQTRKEIRQYRRYEAEYNVYVSN